MEIKYERSHLWQTAICKPCKDRDPSDAPRINSLECLWQLPTCHGNIGMRPIIWIKQCRLERFFRSLINHSLESEVHADDE